MSKRLAKKIINPPVCPYCGSEDTVFLRHIDIQKKYHCNKCTNAFWG